MKQRMQKNDPLAKDIDRLWDCLGLKEGDTYATADHKFYSKVLTMGLTEQDLDDTFGAYINVTDHEGSKAITPRERQLLIDAIRYIVSTSADATA